MKIHNWFIPTKKNKFHPHALRPTGMIVFMCLIALITPIYNITSVGKPQVLGYAVDVTANDIFSLSNNERAKLGLAPFSLNQSLVKAAYAKAQDMFNDNYWAHIAPDGTTPWDFIKNNGYTYSIAGENLAKDFNTSNGVVDGWMNSQAHKDNIINAKFKDVGYAVVNGTLQGSETTLVVAMYGNEVQAQTPVVAEIDQVSNNKPIQSTPAAENITATTNTETPTKSFITSSVKKYTSLNWGQKIALLIISVMISLYLLKHTVIWRQKKRGLKDILLRAHPIGQAMILGISIVVILINSIGVVL